LDGESTEESSIVKEWAFLKAMRFGFTENTDRSFSGIVGAEFMYDLIMVLI
jgi:hypothetical protein